jgi:regulator of replication initiation timing
MEEVATKVMQVDKAIKLFQTMTIVNMNMGNLNLEVISLKNKLTIEEKEKAILQLELDKERDFKKEYKHNIKILKKNRTENEQRLKRSYKNCKIRIKSSKLRQL